MTPGATCPTDTHTGCEHPPGATLYLGGTAWAHPALQPHLAPLDQLIPYPGNPRRGDQDAITASVADLGIYKLQITHQTSTRHILTGNHTAQALTDLAAELAPTTAIDVDDRRAAAIVARDNRTSDLGVNDDSALLALLALDDEVLALSGYADSPAEMLILQRRAEAEDVFTVGTDHMVDEWKATSGQTEGTEYAVQYARAVTVYLRDAAAIDDFSKRLELTDPVGARLHYPLGWEPYDRRLTWQKERADEAEEAATGE